MRSHRALSLGPLYDMPERQESDFVCINDSNVLVYLIHGGTGTPVQMSSLSRKLSQKNRWDVYATTLPGHCARFGDLLRIIEQDWCAHVQRQLSFIRERYEYVFVVGLSAGGLLALEASTLVRVDGVAALSPTFIHDGWNSPWSQAVLPLARKRVPVPLQRILSHIAGLPYGLKDERPQAPVRKSYCARVIVRERMNDWCAQRKVLQGTTILPSSAATKGSPGFPLCTSIEIDRLIMRVLPRLHDVTTPTVILQVREDNMTSPRNSSIVYNAISSQDRLLIVLDDCFYSISVDNQQGAVAGHMAAFFGLSMQTEFSSQQMRVSS